MSNDRWLGVTGAIENPAQKKLTGYSINPKIKVFIKGRLPR
jgi:hypothetical protein